MSTTESLCSRRLRRIRSDGWTAERQLRFLDALAETRSVRKAAVAAGMSREGAHRLRNRHEGGLFAALWDRAITGPATVREGHMAELTHGRLVRLLGNHYRRERGDFQMIGRRRSDSEAGDWTEPL